MGPASKRQRGQSGSQSASGQQERVVKREFLPAIPANSQTFGSIMPVKSLFPELTVYLSPPDPLPPACEMFPGVVYLNVTDGTVKKMWPVYKEVLCRNSSYFSALLRDPPPSGSVQNIDIFDVEMPVLDVFVQWLHTELIYNCQGPDALELLIKLWLVASRFRVPKLQNHALLYMDKLRIERRSILPSAYYEQIYNQTHEGSPLRQYVASLVATGHPVKLAAAHHYPRELLIDMINWTRLRYNHPWVNYSPIELTQFYVFEPAPMPPICGPPALVPATSLQPTLVNGNHVLDPALAQSVPVLNSKASDGLPRLLNEVISVQKEEIKQEHS